MLLLPYQRRWLQDTSSVKLVEKSRRVGLTWATAVECVLDAAEQNGMSSWYLSYAEDQAKEFVLDCANWARRLNIAVQSTGEELMSDEDEQIQVFVIRFDSGHRITALSSNPRNLRGKQGRVIIDEAAYHKDLTSVLKASLALLMWGGRVEIISTHDGEHNPFASLCEEVRDGKRPGWSLHRITLDDALEDGLYRRICLTQDREWTPDAEHEWRREVVEFYGQDADEELFCIPRSSTDAGLFFRAEWFEILEVESIVVPLLTARGWDKGATPVSKDNRDPDWTRGVRMSLYEDESIIVTDVASIRGTPHEVDELMRRAAAADGVKCRQAIWQDPGQAGVVDVTHTTKVLKGFRVVSEVAREDKATYARPFSSYAQRGLVKLLRGPWNHEYLMELQAFNPYALKKRSTDRHDDQVDASSRAFRELTGTTRGEYSVEQSDKADFWKAPSRFGRDDDDGPLRKDFW